MIEARASGLFLRLRKILNACAIRKARCSVGRFRCQCRGGPIGYTK